VDRKVKRYRKVVQHFSSVREDRIGWRSLPLAGDVILTCPETQSEKVSVPLGWFKAGLIHHSDRGSQYASKAFRKLLRINGFKGSMSRKGDCWDNAVVESFFGSLKQERVQWRNYQTRFDAQQDILKYISVWYNPYRLHSTLGYVSPDYYERQLLEMEKLA
jgi:transposase InsO family protein